MEDELEKKRFRLTYISLEELAVGGDQD